MIAERYPSTGISVVIVGAGTAGAFAALECWRNGHDVRILEKASGPYAMGDSYNIGPSAIKAFGSWKGMDEENERLSHDFKVVVRDLQGTTVAPPMDVFSVKDGHAPSRPHRHLRPSFQNMLLDYVRKTGIEVEWDCRASEYYEDVEAGKGVVVLKDGRRLEADVVVAADGVATHSHKAVTGSAVAARSSGYSIYRAVYPVRHIMDDKVVTERFKKEADGLPIIEAWFAPTMQGAVWRLDDLILWSITHQDTGTAEESWSSIVDKHKVLDWASTVSGFPEDRRRLIETAPDNSITDFKMVWRDPQPRCVSQGGRIVQIGDAAHTFFPSSGSGATQGIEDAVSMATCLRLGGRGDIEAALNVHNLLRRDRINCASLMGIVSQNHRQSSDSNATKWDVKEIKKGLRYGKWLWDHDAEVYALDNFDSALSHLRSQTPFTNTNIPPGYTPRDWKIDDVLDSSDMGEELLSGGDWD